MNIKIGQDSTVTWLAVVRLGWEVTIKMTDGTIREGIVDDLLYVGDDKPAIRLRKFGGARDTPPSSAFEFADIDTITINGWV